MTDVEKLIKRLEREAKDWDFGSGFYRELFSKVSAMLHSQQAKLERARAGLVEIAAMEDCYPDVMRHMASSTLEEIK